MEPLNDWSCDFKIDSAATLTVGQKFGILCQGATDLNPNLSPAIINSKDSPNYDLVLLRHKFKSKNELFLSVASWRTGTHKLKSLKLSVSENSILLDGPTIKVDSVLESNSKMNLPPGAIVKSPPAYVWYLLVIILFLGLCYFFKIYRRSRKIDKGLLKLNSFRTSLSIFYEFQKQIRFTKKSCERKMIKKELAQLCKSFYKSTVVFMSLSINTPLFILNEKESQKILRKKLRKAALVNEYFYIVDELKKTTLEIEKEEKVEGIKNLKADLENLVDEANSFSQKINKYTEGAVKR